MLSQVFTSIFEKYIKIYVPHRYEQPTGSLILGLVLLKMWGQFTGSSQSYKLSILIQM